MTAPEQKHQPLTLTIQMFDGLVGKLLPTLLLVGGSLAGFHGKHRIEQQNALLCPMGQVAMGRYLDSQIPMDFLVDIDQRRRGFDPTLHGKTQAMGLVRAVVRILPQDHHLHLVEGGQVEGVEDIRARREHGFSGPLFARQESPQPGHVILFELSGQMLLPAGLQLHVLGTALSHGATTCPASYTCAPQRSSVRSSPGAPAGAARWRSWP